MHTYALAADAVYRERHSAFRVRDNQAESAHLVFWNWRRAGEKITAENSTRLSPGFMTSRKSFSFLLEKEL
jgi:hypothetical protein